MATLTLFCLFATNVALTCFVSVKSGKVFFGANTLVLSYVYFFITPAWLFPLNDALVPSWHEIVPIVTLHLVVLFCQIWYLSATGFRLRHRGVVFSYERSPRLVGAGRLVAWLSIVIFGLTLWSEGGLPFVTKAVFDLAVNSDLETLGAVSEHREYTNKAAYFYGEKTASGVISAIKFYLAGALLGASVVFVSVQKKRWWTFLVVATSALFVWMAVGADGSRGPILKQVIIAVLALGLLRPLPAVALMKAGFSICFVAFALSLYSNKGGQFLAGELSIVEMMTKLLHRFLYGNGEGDVITVKLVQSQKLPLGLGQNMWGEFLNSLPFYSGYEPLGSTVYKLWTGGDKTTYLVGTGLAKAYADFGSVGVGVLFLLLFWVSIYVDLICVRAVRRAPTYHTPMACMVLFVTAEVALVGLSSMPVAALLILATGMLAGRPLSPFFNLRRLF